MTSPPPDLLGAEPEVVTVGVDLFAAALGTQGVVHESVDWRPPEAELSQELSTIAADPRTEEANATAAQRLVDARPHITRITTAREALGIDGTEFLHAGPPIDWADASGPLRGAVTGGLLLEGAAPNAEAAVRLAEAGGISLEPCHAHSTVGPMAGVVTPSMALLEVHDEVHGTTAFCTLNEGLGKVLRYGAYGPEVLERLRWMNDRLAPVLDSTLQATGPIDLRAIVAQALQMGDECHNRNRAGTSLFLREIGAHLIDLEAPTADVAEVFSFINGNDHFFLNLVMAAAKAAADAARGIPGSTMVVAMARNGTDFGIQVAGCGDRWFTAPAPKPDGLLFPGFDVDDVNPDIGDSTITETWGVGGCTMAAAPAIVRFVGGSADLALDTTRSAYEITITENPNFQIPVLDFRGSPTGIDVTRVVRTGILPPVNTGMAGAVAGTGQVGAGLVTPPMGCFTDAVRALAELTTSAGSA
jgi:hypothetical protein